MEEDEERCDQQSVVFNARLTEDEMIITIEEYESLKNAAENYKKAKDEMNAHIHYLEQLAKEAEKQKDEAMQKSDIVYSENQKLKRGIINFIKGLGG